MLDRQTLNRLYRYCFTLIGEESEAYDLLHASVEKYLRINIDTIENTEAYLKRIIRNTYIDQYRKREKYSEEEYDETVTYVDMDISSLENLIADQQQVEQVWKILSSAE